MRTTERGPEWLQRTVNEALYQKAILEDDNHRLQDLLSDTRAEVARLKARVEGLERVGRDLHHMAACVDHAHPTMFDALDKRKIRDYFATLYPGAKAR